MLHRVFTVAVLLLAVAATPASAQVGLPAASILDRATARALDYDAAALKWTCDETVRRIKYDGDGDPSEKRASTFALLLVPDAGEQHPVEWTAKLDEPDHGTTRPPAALRDYPSLTSWLRLFHPATRPWMLISDAGANGADDLADRPFRFRGAISDSQVNDIRAWEGTAWVNPFTGDLVRVEAVPSSQAERIATLVDRRNSRGVGVSIFGFRFAIGPTAHGQRAAVAFGPQQGGFWLPMTARLETFDAVTKHDEQLLRATVVTLSRCREFHAAAMPGR